MSPRRTRLLMIATLAILPALLTGCYTRLTTAKETREWRETYPEIEEKEIIELPIARENLGNAFVMDVSTYLDAIARFQENNDGSIETIGTTGEVFHFRPGSLIRIQLPAHPDSPVNGEYAVTPEGTIDAGPILDLPVAGKTRYEVREILSERLLKYMKPLQDPSSGRIVVSIQLPLLGNRERDVIQFGKAEILALTGGEGGSVTLTGDDTLMSILARSGYHTQTAWKEIAVFRKVRTQQRAANGKPIEYTIVIICDLEEIIYENPNLNMRIRNGDLIYVHPEKAPWIVEFVNTMRVITDVYADFQGVEGVLEDIFNTNF